MQYVLAKATSHTDFNIIIISNYIINNNNSKNKILVVEMTVCHY
jgi:hypothetical protein